MLCFGCVISVLVTGETKARGIACCSWFKCGKSDDISARTFSSFSVKCSQKTVKDAYHIICKPCSLQLEICCKCGKKEDVVIP